MNKDFTYCVNKKCLISDSCKRSIKNHIFDEDVMYPMVNPDAKKCDLYVKKA